ncbi:recombinase family protein [Bacillus cereus]|uniref:recombinase family protein n=1 Tax=Bacillus cereus TaxID=1396 RepID=UPI0024063E16|nr:recombinase family protein [Bacillus cereus]MED3620377.1 recombinase family protein [Bacillus thuringiensis]MDF9506478.1 recombinase family protein [Bacillus cereus]MDF9595103.1 recombinase family protein [Bacillus cereus]MDF9606979.1 recombinase family protein [Bacillus cereus]MDF9657901.1 recombinase family protein [Bacillus cereus]
MRKSELTNQKIVAIYARVSTTEQAEEGYSIDEQIRVLNELCEREGYFVYEEYIDRGISGKNISGRPAVQRLLMDAEQKKFDVVLVWKMNRLARKSLDLMNIVEKLNSKNIAFRSYTEKYETETSTGKLQFQLMAAIAEYERNNIAENVKMGMIARAKEGRWNGGQVLGYDVIECEGSNKKRKNTQLVINEKEAYTIRTIFKMYTSGHGYKSIANTINKLGHRTKKGKTFSLNAIKIIVTNPIYAGYIRYNVRRDWSEKGRNNINPAPIIQKGEHEPIILEGVWNVAQNVFKSRSCKPNRVHDGEFPLTGIMRCPVCGAGMVISRTTNKLKDGTKRVLEYYVCGAWKNKGTLVCRSNGVRTEYADAFVLDKLQRLMRSDKLIKELVKSVNSRNEKMFAPLQKEYNMYAKQMKELEQKMSKTFDAYTDELISKVMYAEKAKKLEEQIQQLKELMEPLRKQIQGNTAKHVSYKLIKEVLLNFSKAFQSALTREQRKRLLHLIIHKITIREDRKIESIHLELNNGILKELKIGADDLSNDESSAPFSILVAI